MLQINILFMQKEERNLDVECAEDDVISAVLSGRSSIIIDPSQSVQLISVPGFQEHILVHFISEDGTNTSDSIMMDQAVSFIFVTIFEFLLSFNLLILCRFIHGFRLEFCLRVVITMVVLPAMRYCQLRCRQCWNLRLTMPVLPAMQYHQLRCRQCWNLRLTLPVLPAMLYHQLKRQIFALIHQWVSSLYILLFKLFNLE